MNLPHIALGLWFSASLAGCFLGQNCDSCGRCTGGSGLVVSEARAADFFAPTVAVWAEPSGEIVVVVSFELFISCSETRTSSIFLRWDPNSRRLEPRVAGPSTPARMLSPTTTGGGVRSYEDIAPGLTLQIADFFSEERVQITASASGVWQVLNCRGNAFTPLECH